MAAAWRDNNPCLSGSILKIMDKFGFQTMTPVQVRKEINCLLFCKGLFLNFDLFFRGQAATIPLFMSNKDVAVEAVSYVLRVMISD